MKILITFDLELFLGNKTGSVEKCFYEPTMYILDILKKFNVSATFFVDAGYLLVLKKLKDKYVNLQKDFLLAVRTIEKIIKANSKVELHIHPQWLKGIYKNGVWYLNNRWYRLQDFPEREIIQILSEGKKILEEVAQEEVVAFRAGGWCIEPFEKLRRCFKSCRIFIDSSVFQGGYIKTDTYNVDFRLAPEEDIYRFSTSPLIPEKNGEFVEIQISSFSYTPLFYLKFIVLKTFQKRNFSQFGDGYPITGSQFNKIKYFLKLHCFPVSLDLYRASVLEKAFKKRLKLGKKIFVVMGHPKRMSRYSLQRLEEFVKKYVNNYEFGHYKQFKSLNAKP